jgi:hypothetical protein
MDFGPHRRDLPTFAWRVRSAAIFLPKRFRLNSANKIKSAALNDFIKKVDTGKSSSPSALPLVMLRLGAHYLS